MKRLSLAAVFAAFAVGTFHAQTALVPIDAELALSFGAAKGQVAFVGSHIVCVSAENPTVPSSSAAAAVAEAPVAGASAVLASYPVKHDHTIGSCQGTLIMTADAVSFESPDRIEDARQWKVIDIKKVEQTGIYKLKVEPFQGDAFNFELNGKGIDSSEFRQLQDRIARARVR